MSVAFYPTEKTLLFAIRDFEPATQRLLMSTLDVNGLIVDLQAFKVVVARHIDELIKDPKIVEAARHIAYKGQILPLLRDETNALNFQYNTYKIYLSDLGKEAAPIKKLCIDFDHTLSKGHQGDSIEGPFEGAIEALRKLKADGFEIIIYSCRANSDHGLKQIQDWLKKYNCPYDEIFIGKPEAMAYVDDRAISFKGNWADVVKDIGVTYDAELNKSTSVSIFLSIPSSTHNQLSSREGEASSPLSAKEVSSAFLPSLPGVVWEVHDGPDMQHSPSTPLEMLHPVNEWNTYDSYTTLHDKKDPSGLLHFLTLEDIEKDPDQASDVKEADEAKEALNTLETTLGKRDISKQAATNEEHLAHIKELVAQRQFERAVAYITENKINAPKLLKDLEDRSSKATILNKDQALLLLEKGSQGAQSNAVKWLAKNNNITELSAAFTLVAFNPVIAKQIIDVFRDNKNVIALNRLFANKGIPENTRREIVDVLVGMKYTPIVDEAIKDDSALIRSAGFKAAAGLKDKFHLLDKGTEDPLVSIRREVYGYLWGNQSPEAIELFSKGLKDSDPQIQNFVKQKLSMSGGLPGQAPVPKGDELTKEMIEKAIAESDEYFKKHPELAEKLKKELEEREKTMQYNRSLIPESPKKSSLDKEAIQPPAGMTMAIEPAFDWGERDDGLLAKDVKQFYGRPKSEYRNDMNLLPEFLKKMIEDQDMDTPEDAPVKLGAGNAVLPPGTPFRLKVNIAGAPAGTPGYILWQTDVPTTYYVWIKGIESDPTDIPLPLEYMELEKKPVTPEVEELGQSIADQIKEDIKREKEENAPQTPADVKVMDPKTLKHKRDEMLDNMLKHPEGSPERKKWEDRLKALGTRVAPSNPDVDLMDLVYYPNSDKARGVIDRISDSPEFMALILRRVRELKDNGRISDRQMVNFSQELHNKALGKGTIKPGQRIVASPLSQKEAAENVYDDFEQTAIDDERRMERTEDDEGVLIMDRDWISDTQTFPRGVPSPPARWTPNNDEREGEEGKPGVGGTKLRNGPTYWEPSPGNLDGMPAGQSFSSLTAEVDNSGARVTGSWEEEHSEQEVTLAMISFVKAHLPQVFDKFKSISSEYVDLPNRTLVLKFQDAKEHNEEK